jgi:hypothetical protein
VWFVLAVGFFCQLLIEVAHAWLERWCGYWSRFWKMAEWEDEYEVKDEELVDFEGSDYGFDSDDERLEEEVTAVERNGSSNHKRSETEQAMAAPAPAAMDGNNKTLEKKEKENEEKENKKMGALKLQNQRKEAEKSSAGLERGGHHNNKQDDGKRDATVAPVSKSSVALLEGEGKGVGLSRHKKHHKADLEDGELDDAAMVILAFFSLDLPTIFPLYPILFLSLSMSLSLGIHSFFPPLRDFPVDVYLNYPHEKL